LEVIQVVEVQVKEKESFERALRRFKKMWERAGVLREIRNRAFYEKPSDAKRETKKKTVRRIKRLARIEALRNNPRASQQRRRRRRK
jgi:small subunit ribosomal protein S21